MLVDHGSQLSLALDAGAGRSPLALLLEGISCAGDAILLSQKMAQGLHSAARIGKPCCVSAILYACHEHIEVMQVVTTDLERGLDGWVDG